ncbi:hypothetical protein MKW94_015531 [Papaver nudicaule]|uniref:Dof zinc finger protein n=1 Tax=Papaver nudicaule TaxID=74823 RepID=A0AA41V204_PAPNU|nr:hypothetical protein [Papaver nudicaule]
MGLTSLQVCMDTSEWLQGAVHEENGLLDHSSSPSGGDMVTRPAMLERRLRPPHDHALKCPRCDSAHTKFCYYNNYSLSQPRYFCKTCRRYWTKGGSLRNIPVGGGCRKNNNKRVASKKSTPTTSSSNDHLHQALNQLSSVNSSSNNDTRTTDLQLSFPHDHHLQLSSHFSTFFGDSSSSGVELGNLSSFMENKYHALLDNPIRQVDFMECTRYDNMVGNPSSSIINHDFMSNCGEPSSDEQDLGNLLAGLGNHHNHSANSSNFNGLNPFGSNNDSESSLMMMNNSCQRLMQQLPFDRNHLGNINEDHINGYDVKPNKHLLSLDQWHDPNHNNNQQGCSEVLGKDSFGYNSFNSLGSWSGAAAAAMLNGYGSSHQQVNPLV